MTRRSTLTTLALAAALAVGAGCSDEKAATSNDSSIIPRPRVTQAGDGATTGPTVVLPGNPAAIGPNGPGR